MHQIPCERTFTQPNAKLAFGYYIFQYQLFGASDELNTLSDTATCTKILAHIKMWKMADIKMVCKMSIWFDPKMLKNTIKICCNIEYETAKICNYCLPSLHK